jgi:hypothetical protein
VRLNIQLTECQEEEVAMMDVERELQTSEGMGTLPYKNQPFPNQYPTAPSTSAHVIPGSAAAVPVHPASASPESGLLDLAKRDADKRVKRLEIERDALIKKAENWDIKKNSLVEKAHQSEIKMYAFAQSAKDSDIAKQVWQEVRSIPFVRCASS